MDFVKTLFKKYNILFTEDNITFNIIDLFINNNINENNTDVIYVRYVGLYHRHITKNYEEMKKYYLRAIEKGDSTAMNNLGLYHENITKNYEEMKKYYLMAIEKGNNYSMSNLKKVL
mgnify:CR=1 FL=1